MPKQRSVAFVFDHYPPSADDHAVREIRALEDRGLEILAVSLGRRRETRTDLATPHRPLPSFLWRQPLRVLKAWFRARRMPGYRGAVKAWFADLRRDPRPRRARLFGQAVVLAHELPERFAHLHAQSLDAPATVSRYAAAICGANWTCSAHSTDTWTVPEWDKREKLEDCRWAVACTAIAARHLQNLSPAPGRVELVYHGLDFTALPAAPSRPARDGGDANDPVVILSIGRAIERKGIEVLLDALGGLRDLHWRLVHIGGGPRLSGLKKRAADLGIDARITWLDFPGPEDALVHVRGADLFALASRIAGDGDRDGMPVSLLTAQSQGLPCVATAVSGIPELITNGETGVLVPPDDPVALREALADLIRDPGLRASLGAAGENRARMRFRFEGGLERLAAKFGLPRQTAD